MELKQKAKAQVLMNRLHRVKYKTCHGVCAVVKARLSGLFTVTVASRLVLPTGREGDGSFFVLSLLYLSSFRCCLCV